MRPRFVCTRTGGAVDGGVGSVVVMRAVLLRHAVHLVGAHPAHGVPAVPHHHHAAQNFVRGIRKLAVRLAFRLRISNVAQGFHAHAAGEFVLGGREAFVVQLGHIPPPVAGIPATGAAARVRAGVQHIISLGDFGGDHGQGGGSPRAQSIATLKYFWYPDSGPRAGGAQRICGCERGEKLVLRVAVTVPGSVSSSGLQHRLAQGAVHEDRLARAWRQGLVVPAVGGVGEIARAEQRWRRSTRVVVRSEHGLRGRRTHAEQRQRERHDVFGGFARENPRETPCPTAAAPQVGGLS